MVDPSGERRRQPPGYFDGLHGRRLLRRIASLTAPGGPDGECWDWLGAYSGAPSGLGYPALSMKVHGVRRVCRAHRVAYMAAFGPVPEGEPLHHKCGRSCCVRPEHLTPVTAAENTAEMLARGALEARIRQLEAALAQFRPDEWATEV